MGIAALFFSHTAPVSPPSHRRFFVGVFFFCVLSTSLYAGRACIGTLDGKVLQSGGVEVHPPPSGVLREGHLFLPIEAWGGRRASPRRCWCWTIGQAGGATPNRHKHNRRNCGCSSMLGNSDVSDGSDLKESPRGSSATPPPPGASTLDCASMTS